VVVASRQRLALMREFERPAQLTVHHLIAELYEGVDWVLVEGFKDSDLLKIEVWRPQAGKPALYSEDAFIVAIATDSPAQLPQPTLRPVLDLNAPDAVAQWLVQNQDRFEYRPERYA
jgi:molybdopterin-guanine dinucleotide biosynthesis adapter protein